MPVIKGTQYEIEFLARLMRAEAESDGDIARLLVGMVGVNRVLANCSDFRYIYDMEDMVYQSPGGFEATLYSYFYQRARENEIQLAKRVINGENLNLEQLHFGFMIPSNQAVLHNFGDNGIQGVMEITASTSQEYQKAVSNGMSTHIR